MGPLREEEEGGGVGGGEGGGRRGRVGYFLLRLGANIFHFWDFSSINSLVGDLKLIFPFFQFNLA